MFYNKIKLSYLVGVFISTQTTISYSSQVVTFTDIAKNNANGINYERFESPRIEYLREIQENGFFLPQSAFDNPLKAHGAPGTVIFDFDGDGDLDVYVTNGPGKQNSLYANQFSQIGVVKFNDVALDVGVDLTNQDSTGVCYGDIDNDGDQDLLVLSSADGNTLFQNNHGMFEDISSNSGLDQRGLYSSSCSMGDVNNDGLLDIAVANTYDDWSNFGPIVDFDQAFRNQDNQLFINKSNNVFEDRSVESGITNYQGITWAIALVDYDLDGDVDLIAADDQGAKAGLIRGGKDTGYVRIYNNDGKANFTDVTVESSTNRFGAWMSLSFADYNSDGYMDIFASNIGDYMARAMDGIVGFEIVPGDWNSGWFLGNAENKFTFPNVGDLKATPFGWGSASFDYDNDADTDIVYHGGIDMGMFVDGSNPGSVLNNDGSANFSLDTNALISSSNHSRRAVMGLAIGDLNNDGYSDMVSVSASDWPEQFPLVPLINTPFNGPFDSTAFLWPTFMPNDSDGDLSKGFSWTQMPKANGTLAIEINSANNSNNWFKVKLKGTKGITNKGVVNRDAIGAVLMFTPKGGKTAMIPLLGGAGYASQNDLTTIFGMGDKEIGKLEILWPGGIKNVLYNVRAGEVLTMPEIPCNYTDNHLTKQKYHKCVTSTLNELVRAGELSKDQSRRILISSMESFYKHKRERKDHGNT